MLGREDPLEGRQYNSDDEYGKMITESINQAEYWNFPAKLSITMPVVMMNPPGD
ncbi:hypothetical protein Pint_30474 [Pistacia integerrima]|uniref:Uncharacterized protein n=1 Tax=Pistacia integerrima TaxID=434235 RepID=A0ACC0X288_9ROSI|nr:hypothetical protein Pint_30474 [Pistacia integerrima]